MTHGFTSDPTPGHRTLRRWMQWCIVAVFAAVMVGGITRLTESGLSIIEWHPVSGVFPPTTDADWQAAFAAFQRIPQARTVHAGITMEQFKWIYWWEWFHRILARGVGLVFAIPYLWLMARGTIPRGLRLRLTALPLLTLGQGVLGWYMVQSGLAVRTSVSAYRLTAHLALALGILAVALWTWADLRAEARRAADRADPGSAGGGTSTRDLTRDAVLSRDLSAVALELHGQLAARWRVAVLALLALVVTTVLSGGFVAGLDAGRVFNTFPLMEGEFVPVGYAMLDSWWRNAFENPIAAQLHHRILAITTAIVALIAWVRIRDGNQGATVTKAVTDLGKTSLLQVALGIATLLLAVPVWLGVLHQFMGVLVLCTAILAWHAVAAARGTTPS